MKIEICHLLADKLNLYGDRGNVMVLQKRLEWRGIDVVITDSLTPHTDLLCIGGGSDREQGLAENALQSIKQELKAQIEDGLPVLAICGGYQFLGESYITLQKETLAGLHLLDFYTECKPVRAIGNLIVESEDFGEMMGFENHGGRTYHAYEPLGKVILGVGNNEEEQIEGLRYHHVIGTYMHGPVLAKNPVLADWLLQKAVERKKESVVWSTLEDNWEEQAKKTIKQLYMK